MFWYINFYPSYWTSHWLMIPFWLQTVYDHDTFSKDDKMGDAEFDITPYIEALRMDLTGIPSGTVVKRIQPSRQNCLASESCIYYSNGKVIQDMILRLRNVECGEVEIQLHWIDLPGSKGLWSHRVCFISNFMHISWLLPFNYLVLQSILVRFI